MDWIFDNLQLIIVVSGAVAYWLNQRKREKEGQDADYDGDGKPEFRGPVAPNADAMEEAERTRRIQEEIRRKILERRSGGAPAPMPVPVPVEDMREVPGWQGEGPRPRTLATPPPLDEAVMSRQRALQEQLDALEIKRAATRARAESRAFPSAPPSIRSAGTKVVETRPLVLALRNPASLRQAVVLREVLGPPVGLR
jgi:hypothetical protein